METSSSYLAALTISGVENTLQTIFEDAPDDLELQRKKCKKAFDQKVSRQSAPTTTSSILATRVIKAYQDPATQPIASAAGMKLVKEFLNQGSMPEARDNIFYWVLDLFNPQEASDQTTFNAKAKEIFTSEEFLKELPLLPSYNKVLEQFPEAKALAKLQIQKDALALKEAVQDFTESSIESFLSQSNKFLDAFTDKLLEKPVRLTPVDPELNPVNFSTAVALLEEKTWEGKAVMHPTLKNEELIGFIEAGDVTLAMQRVTYEVVKEMTKALKEGQHEYFEKELEKYAAHLIRQSGGNNMGEILERINELKTFFKSLRSPQTNENKGFYEVMLSLFTLLTAEKRLQGRETLKEYIQSIQDSGIQELELICTEIETFETKKSNHFLTASDNYKAIKSKLATISTYRKNLILKHKVFVDHTIKDLVEDCLMEPYCKSSPLEFRRAKLLNY